VKVLDRVWGESVEFNLRVTKSILRVRKIKTKEAAIENVKRLFSNTPEKDSVSIKDAFVAWQRPNPENVEENKAWLSNMLFHLKYHNLLNPVYSYRSGRKTLDKLQLTFEGKKALGMINSELGTSDTDTSINNGLSLSFTDVMKIIAKLRKDNPDYEITFDVRLKTS